MDHLNDGDWNMLRQIAFSLLVLISSQSWSQKGRIHLVNMPDTSGILAAYYGFDRGGNTSVAFDLDDSFKWSGESPFKKDGFGYFSPDGKEIPYIKRDRDIGQTFRIDGTTPVKLRSLTVRLGFGDNVVRPGMYNKKLSVQFFEVSGEPTIYNNGSKTGARAFHGFPHDRLNSDIPPERDDYLTGEKYEQIALFTGFTFPGKEEFGFEKDTTVPPDHEKLKGRLLKFSFPEGNMITLEPGRQYAFMILINRQGENVGFTLANNYTGNYPGGHAIRRDGSGTFPPAIADPSHDFRSPANKAAFKSAHFPAKMRKRLSINPSTNGYPDVDTWRDIYFILAGFQDRL